MTLSQEFNYLKRFADESTKEEGETQANSLVSLVETFHNIGYLAMTSGDGLSDPICLLASDWDFINFAGRADLDDWQRKHDAIIFFDGDQGPHSHHITFEQIEQ